VWVKLGDFIQERLGNCAASLDSIRPGRLERNTDLSAIHLSSGSYPQPSPSDIRQKAEKVEYFITLTKVNLVWAFPVNRALHIRPILDTVRKYSNPDQKVEILTIISF
jgi:hypothetical protein